MTYPANRRLILEMLPGGKIRITSNSLPSGDATILPGKELAIRIENSGEVYESSQAQLLRHIIPGGLETPNISGNAFSREDDFDDPPEVTARHDVPHAQNNAARNFPNAIPASFLRWSRICCALSCVVGGGTG